LVVDLCSIQHILVQCNIYPPGVGEVKF